MNRRIRLHALVVAAAIALSSAAVRAQPDRPNDRRRVLLLVENAGDPLMGRIKAEIASLGLDAVVRTPQGPIEASARAEHAVAAIRVLPARNGVENWRPANRHESWHFRVKPGVDQVRFGEP